MSDLVGLKGILLARCPVGVVARGMTDCVTLRTVVNHDLPKTILGVVPPLQDGFANEGDIATCFVKKIPHSPRCTGQQ